MRDSWVRRSGSCSVRSHWDSCPVTWFRMADSAWGKCSPGVSCKIDNNRIGASLQTSCHAGMCHDMAESS